MSGIEKKAFIFGAIFTLSNKLQVLGDKFDENLTVKQWLLLAGIFKSDSDAPTISDVAKITGNSRQNVKKMALILEKSGYICFEKDTNDARILRISLTVQCMEYLKLREKKEEEFLDKLFESFSEDEINSLALGLTKLEENMAILGGKLFNEKNKKKG